MDELLDTWHAYPFLGNYLALPDTMPIANLSQLLETVSLARSRARREIHRSFQEDIRFFDQEVCSLTWASYAPIIDGRNVCKNGLDYDTESFVLQCEHAWNVALGNARLRKEARIQEENTKVLEKAISEGNQKDLRKIKNNPPKIRI